MASLNSRPSLSTHENSTAAAPEQIPPVQESLIDASLNEQRTVDREEGNVVLREPQAQFTREQLYNEVWEISVAGVARKYSIQYGYLIKQIKEAAIPIPSSSYWANLRVRKPVTKTELSGFADEVVTLYKLVPSEQKEQTKDRPQQIKSTSVSGKSSAKLSSPEDGKSDAVLEPDDQTIMPTEATNPEVNKPETYKYYGQTYNVYDRETLYKQVWEKPVTEVAKLYMVSDVAIHKVCKSLDIPTPPLGYWAKVRAGKPVTKVPLPKSSKPVKKNGLRTEIPYYPKLDRAAPLAFLNEEDRAIVLSVAAQIVMPDEKAKIHPKIVDHRKTVMEWKKSHKERTGGWNRRNREEPPLLAENVSEEAIPRICRIVDSLIKAMEPLGCSLTDNLVFVINGETVPLSFSEAQDEIPHIPTTEENIALIKYEEDKRRYSFASKPNIRKYDRPFNGRISMSIYTTKSFRDSKSAVMEERLGEIMIELYEASDAVRKEREAREEAERKRQEETSRQEELKNRYNAEVDRTRILINLAEDYDIACRIRQYILAVKATGSNDEKTRSWIEWANDKADWFDPTIAKDDEIFGKRKHEKDADYKKLEHVYRWW